MPAKNMNGFLGLVVSNFTTAPPESPTFRENYKYQQNIRCVQVDSPFENLQVNFKLDLCMNLSLFRRLRTIDFRSTKYLLNDTFGCID